MRPFHTQTMRFPARLRQLGLRLSLAMLEAGIAWTRAVGDRVALVEDLLEAGRLQGESGHLGEAELCFTEARGLALQLRDEYLTSRSNVQLASSLMVRNEFEEAADLLKSSLPALRKSHQSTFLIDALLRLAYANNNQAKWAEAIHCFEEAIPLAVAARDTRRLMFALDDMGGIAYRQRDFETAESYWRWGLDVSKSRRDKAYEAKFSFFLAVALHKGGRVDSVRDLLVRSQGLYSSLGQQKLADRSDRFIRNELGVR